MLGGGHAGGEGIEPHPGIAERARVIDDPFRERPSEAAAAEARLETQSRFISQIPGSSGRSPTAPAASAPTLASSRRPRAARSTRATKPAPCSNPWKRRSTPSQSA